MNTERTILHVDMNNFYASVECLMNPTLKNYAVAVTGNPEKRTGIVLAKNYLAKVYGVKTGDVIWEAKQKCPTLVCVSPHFELYEDFSKRAHKIYAEYTDIIEPFGIDECWLDVTGSLKFFNCTAEELAKQIQARIKKELGLSVSIGVSFGKTLAKLGSDMKKPMGLTIINHQNHLEILKKTPIENMIMIGKHTAQKLKSMNVLTLLDLYNLKTEFLTEHFGVVGEYLHNAVAGINDDILITPQDEDTKSVGNGATAVKDMKTLEEIKNFLHNLASKVSARLRAHGFRAKTLHVGIKFADFSYVSAQHSYSYAFSNEQDIFTLSYELFLELVGKTFNPIRAIRICLSSLEDGNSQQMNIFANTKNENLCATIDYLKEKFGENIISKGKDFKQF